MVPKLRVRESVSRGFAEDRGMLMILGRYNLVPGSNRFISRLFGQLLGYGGFGEVFCLNNADM